MRVKMCLRWQVLAGVAALAAGVWFAAPELFAAAAPLIFLAVCPLSMMLMMRGTSGFTRGGSPHGESQPDKLPRGPEDARVAELEGQLRELKASQEEAAATSATSVDRAG